MHTTLDEKPTSTSIHLHEKLIALNKSVKGILPAITTKNVDDIFKLTTETSLLAWNWSKSFNT